MRKFLIVFCGGLIFYYGVYVSMKNHSNSDLITMGVRADWGPLTPPEQSTYIAEIILGNVFETLVDFDLEGNLRPKLAISWKVSPDLKTYEFILDTSVKFSNGENLSAQVYKKSLEHSLQMLSASSNPSSLDVLYKLEGFENFSRDHVLSGITTPAEDTLIFKFKTPFRQALSYLSGIRYAVYQVDSLGKYYGTGPYVLHHEEKNEVSLKVNPYSTYSPHIKNARIIGISGPQYTWGQAICEQQFDIVIALYPDKFDGCNSSQQYALKMESGAFNMNTAIEINGLKGRFFSNQRMRRAIQYLILKHAGPILQKVYDAERVILDPQMLLPLQPGRLSDEEAQNLVNQGEEWVPELIKASHKHPIQFWVVDKKDQLFKDALSQEGVVFHKGAHLTNFSDNLERYYKSYDFDLIGGGAGVGGYDPDDLYHYLGKNGSITSPAVGREKVWETLEEGRSVHEQNQLKKIYEEFSQAVLLEVPIIHLAHSRIGFFYNIKKIKMDQDTVNYYRFGFLHFSTM